MRSLATSSPPYHAKVLELQDTVRGWLAYTTASFTHYTSHTVEHSEEIIGQISNLLFRGGELERPVVKLSPTEAYVLCAAALLHDAGMVVSDSEKTHVLSSQDWKAWLVADANAARRYEEIVELRNASGRDEDDKHFAADRQLRFLLSEFVRRTHHQRTLKFITEHQASLGRFAYDDPVLLRTIGAVCLAHGLTRYELDDREHFPEQRDIRGDKVNVRFCALLLRLGDLLDMSHDRACPLLMNAASPLPAESIAHWTQYQRIVHRVTDPAIIEISAECDNQDEHRYLQDWCQWLVDEVESTRALMSRATRHAEWVPPQASLAPGGSISIRPAQDASYIPTEWQLMLDPDAVFSRLIHDANPFPNIFIRELLQNAFDASRSKMYDDMRAEGLSPPIFPQDAPDVWREQYAIRVERYRTTRFNEMSQQEEERDVVAVEDAGIGMDRDIVLRYFLQVGRSYYTSQEFASRFGFVPTSRFGIGFLSVFAVSDEVQVQTLRDATHLDEALALTLTGPRSYLLTERGERQQPGTRVEVTLRQPLEDGALAQLVREWCPRVEFPIVVTDMGTVTNITAETPDDFVYEEPDLTKEGAVLGVRAYPVALSGITGEIYIFYRSSDVGESWVAHAWAEYSYPKLHPAATPPRLPEDMVSVHGVRTSASWQLRRGVTARVDYRKAIEGLSLDRELLVPYGQAARFGLDDPELQDQLDSIVQDHLTTAALANGDESWSYKQQLIGSFGFRPFWEDVEGTVRAYRQGAAVLLALSEAAELEFFDVVRRIGRTIGGDYLEEVLSDQANNIAFRASDLAQWAPASRQMVFSDRAIGNAEWQDDAQLRVSWELHRKPNRLALDYGAQIADVVPIPTESIGFRIHHLFNETYPLVLLNDNHSFVTWILRAREAALKGKFGLGPLNWETLSALLAPPLSHRGLHRDRLEAYLEKWQDIEGLPSELLPPTTHLSQEMFEAAPPK